MKSLPCYFQVSKVDRIRSIFLSMVCGAERLTSSIVHTRHRDGDETVHGLVAGSAVNCTTGAGSTKDVGTVCC